MVLEMRRMSLNNVSRNDGITGFSHNQREVLTMKDRKRQRENRRLKNKEELLDKKNGLGVTDLTAYNAVKQIASQGKAAIVLR